MQLKKRWGLNIADAEGLPQAGECGVKGINSKENHLRPDPGAEATRSA